MESNHLYGTRRATETPHGPLSMPLDRSSTVAQSTAEDVRALGSAERGEPFYQRMGHPNGRAFESLVAMREGADGAVSFASGMAAITASILAYVRHGDRVLIAEEIYGGTAAFAAHDLPRFGVEVQRFSALDPDELAGALAQPARLVVFESPINPTLRVVDLQRVTGLCRAAGAWSILDGTFAPPPIQRALDHGVDLVVHSATKFLGGHSDVLAGVVAGRHELLEPLEAFRRRSGGLLAPDPAWLLCRSYATLDLRLQEQQRAAAEVAHGLVERLGQGRLRSVSYPGLPDHPDRALIDRQMGGPGCLVSFEVEGGIDGARAVFDRLQLIARAPSLGSVESLASLPSFTTHAALSAEERQRAGIAEGLVRIAVGLEGAEELLADLRRAIG